MARAVRLIRAHKKKEEKEEEEERREEKKETASVCQLEEKALTAR